MGILDRLRWLLSSLWLWLRRLLSTLRLLRLQGLSKSRIRRLLQPLLIPTTIRATICAALALVAAARVSLRLQ